MRNTGCFLGEIVSSIEISAEEQYFSIYIARQQQMAVFIGELTMNFYGGCPSNSSYLTRHFTAFLEASHCAMENDKIRSVDGIAVAFAINALESALPLQLLNQILVE